VMRKLYLRRKVAMTTRIKSEFYVAIDLFVFNFSVASRLYVFGNCDRYFVSLFLIILFIISESTKTLLLTC
jgi:hypothetical protein